MLDIINLFRANAHVKDNYIDIPNVLNQVKPSDCSFESTTSHLAQKLRLYRTNDEVGPKVLFYVVNSKKNETMKETREIVFKFFKDHLGFSKDFIIEIDWLEILDVETHIRKGEKEYFNKFSDSTRKKLTALAT